MKQSTEPTSSILHGLSNHRLYFIWTGIMQRCYSEGSTSYKYYGALGITVCERWKNVANFIEDMYPTYKEGLSIDREDSTGNYEPSNCRWTTNEVQHRNTKLLKVDNKSGYRGVSFCKIKQRWRTSIKVDKKSIHLGYHKEVLEAAIAYDTYVIANNLEHTLNGVLL